MHDWAEAGSRHPLVVIASVRGGAAAARRQTSPTLAPIELVAGGRGHDLAERLGAGSSTSRTHRVDMVSRRGEFAVRGGILDVFPPTRRPPRTASSSSATRSSRSARSRSPTSGRCRARSQRGRARRRAASCCSPRPCASARASCSDEFPGISRACSRRWPRASPSRAWSRSLPALVDRLVTLADYLPEGIGGRRCVDPERVASRARSPSARRTASSSRPRGARRPPAPRRPIDLGAGDFLTLPAAARGARQRAAAIAWWTLSAFDSGTADAAAEGLLERRRRRAESPPRRSASPATPCRRFQGNVDGADAHVGGAARATAGASSSRHPGHGLVERARDVLAERGHRRAHASTRCRRRPSPASPTSCMLDARARASRCRRPSSPCSPRPSSTAARSAATSGRSRSSRRAGATSSTRCS